VKLPATRKDRAQWATLLIVLVVLALYGVMHLTVLPLVRTSRKLQKELAELGGQIEQGERAVRSARNLQAEVQSVCADLAVLTNSYVLRPVLGSYQIQDQFDRFVRGTGFTVASVREVGRQDVPRPAGAAEGPSSFTRLVAEVSGQASFADVAAILANVERLNPFLGISEFSLAGQPDNPDRHRVFFRLEWLTENEKPAAPAGAAPPTAPGAPVPASSGML
jgi:type II secretory pathway pseudopilin PulG